MKQVIFKRLPTTIRHVIGEGEVFLPETNRYHLIVSYACPWAHRTLIYRKIKGFLIIFQLRWFTLYMGPNGWDFADGDGVIRPTFGEYERLGDIL